MSIRSSEHWRRSVVRALVVCGLALLAIASVSCGGGGSKGDDAKSELQKLLERMVLAQSDLPPGLERASVSFSTNEDTANAKGDPKTELAKLQRQGRRLGIDVNYLPADDVPADFALRGGAQATVSLYETADGASESFQEGVEGARQADLASNYPDLKDVKAEEIDRQIGDESVWFRASGFSDAGDLVIDDQVAFRVGAARGFLRTVSLFGADAGRDSYLDEVAALIKAAADRIAGVLASSSP